MKKLILIALALLTLGSTMQVSAAKKKEKKGLTWEWDGTKSGNETIDAYLMRIDSLYKAVISYRDSVDAFQFKCDTITVGGKIYEMAYMLNPDGELVTQGMVNYQFMQATMNGMNIVLDMTSAGLGSVGAAAALPQLGFAGALSYGKYVKGGPAVISQGIATVKTIRGKWISNLRTWRGLKNDALTPEEVAALGIFNAETLEKVKKCVYIKEVKPEAPEYNDIKEVQQSKSQEELDAIASAAIGNLDQAQVAAEDAEKNLDNLDDIDQFTGDV
jgi:hypothetical protein